MLHLCIVCVEEVTAVFVTVVIDDIVVGTDVEDEVVVVGAGNEVVVITVLVTVVFTVCGCY